MSTATNFYKAKQLGNVEVATLVNDVPLPKYDKSLKVTIHKDSEVTINFTPITTAYKSMIAEFYIAIEIPNLPQDGKIEKDQAAPRVQHGGNQLNTTAYRTGNTIKLEIPKYLVMMFDNKIPKGTKFLVASLANEADASKIRIISLYNSSPSQIKDEVTQTTVLGGGR